jgi:hypothetical protein
LEFPYDMNNKWWLCWGYHGNVIAKIHGGTLWSFNVAIGKWPKENRWFTELENSDFPVRKLVSKKRVPTIGWLISWTIRLKKWMRTRGTPMTKQKPSKWWFCWESHGKKPELSHWDHLAHLDHEPGFVRTCFDIPPKKPWF